MNAVGEASAEQQIDAFRRFVGRIGVASEVAPMRPLFQLGRITCPDSGR